MGVKLASSGGGSVQINAPSTVNNFTATLPAATTTLVGADAAQTLTNKTLTSPTITSPTIDSAPFATVVGDAPMYACRAWVNFDGTTNTAGLCTIRASGNVTSVTDNGTGDYTILFTNAMPDANYMLLGTVQQGSALVVVGPDASSSGGTPNLYTASQVRIQCYSAGGTIDPANVSIAIFR